MTTASLSHIAEKLSGLLQQPHQAALGEVPSRAHAVLVWGQDVIRHRRFLQHVGGDVLGVENSQPINQISRLNQIFNHVADFKRRCPTVEKGTNLMSVQSMTCCLQVTMSCTASAADVLCLTQSIDNAVAMVTAMIACYQFSETVCSQRPAGAHFPFPPSQLQRHRVMQRHLGPYFYVDVMSVELPPLDAHTTRLGRHPQGVPRRCVRSGRRLASV